MIHDEEMRNSKPRFPFLVVGAFMVGIMFCWVPFLMGGAAVGSILDSNTNQAKAVGGQSERGDETREQMKREYAERRAREKEKEKQ